MWLGLLAPFLIVAGIFYLVARRGREMAQLARDGVETTGTVERMIEHSGGFNSRRNSRRIRYSYVDEAGRAHAHVSMATSELWHAHEPGGPIAVVYSRSKPDISAPRHLAQLARRALDRK